MEVADYLGEIAAVLGLAILVLLGCNLVRLPAVVGLLLTGLLAGPGGFGLFEGTEEDIRLLAEIGVVLLMFVIGIDFSLRKLLQIRRIVFLGGTLQVGLTTLLTFGLAIAFGIGWPLAVLMGFIVSMTSTTIMLGTLERRAELDSVHGRISLGISIFQDISAVVMVLVTPMLAGRDGGSLFSIIKALGTSLLILVAVALLAGIVVPRLLRLVVGTRSREMFILTIAVISLAVPWATAMAGLSLAIGAFLAGVIISETEYSHQALAGITPFKDIFASLFFISIGMLLDLGLMAREPILLVGLALAVVLLKVIAAGAATMALGYTARMGLGAGLTLCTIGEFSFIIAAAGLAVGLIDAVMFQRFIAITILTMVASPFLISAAPGLMERVPTWRPRLRWLPHPPGDLPIEVRPHDHLLIIGYGVTGRQVARAASQQGLKYHIVELNPQTVRREQAEGEPIMWGDASQPAVLQQAGVDAARMVVVAVPDPNETRKITQLARRLNTKVTILARSKFASEMEPLLRLGADEVVPDEFEASVAIVGRVLRRALVPLGDIEELLADIRADGYGTMRGDTTGLSSLGDLRLGHAGHELAALRVAEHSALIGQTPARLELRRRHGLTLLAIRRDEYVLSNPGAEEKLRAGDELIIFGSSDSIAEFAPQAGA